MALREILIRHKGKKDHPPESGQALEQVPEEFVGSPSWRYSQEAGLGDFQRSPP